MRCAQVENEMVLQVTVSDKEQYSADWLMENVGGVWVAVPEGMAVSPGFAYDADRDAFIPPTPFPSWVLDEATCQWEAPVAYPAEGVHVWDEEAGDWVEVTNETV